MRGRGRTRYGESRVGFKFQISIIVGSLRCCKVKEFGVVLMGNWDRNLMRLSVNIFYGPIGYTSL